MNKDSMNPINDNFELQDEYDFSKGIRGRFYNPQKKSTTIRLDDDVILYFKKMAGEQKVGYQTLMNSALREYIHDHAGSILPEPNN
jgi:uncharacterized protein (DUF4415 family)